MKNLILASTLSMILAGCSGGGSSSSNGGSPTKTPVAPADSVFSKIPSGLYFEMFENCVYEHGKGYYNTMIMMDQNNSEMALIKTFFYETSCTVGEEKLYESVVFNFSSSSQSTNGFEFLNLSLIDAQISIVWQPFLDEFNSNNTFGKTWVLGNPNSVIDLKPYSEAPIMFKTGTITSLSVKLEGSTLIVNNRQYRKQ